MVLFHLKAFFQYISTMYSSVGRTAAITVYSVGECMFYTSILRIVANAEYI